MTTIIPRIILIATCLIIAVAAKADTPYMEAVDRADKACAKGEWLEAAQALDKALTIEPANPGNILLMSNLGMIQFNMGQDSLALATLSDAHRRAPRSVTILSNRARVLTAMGADLEAISDYGRIIELDSTDLSARLHHGLLSLRHRRYNDAKEDVDFLTTHHPDNLETAIAAATLHCSLGEYAEAIPFYNRILDTEKVAEYYGARAYCRLMTGDLQEASDDIACALELDPTDGELYLYRAALNKMRFRPDDARRDARRAVELGTDPRRAAEFMK